MKPKTQVLKELKEIKIYIYELRQCAIPEGILKPWKKELERMAGQICDSNNIDWNDFLNIDLTE
jgi:hypothetical protein